MRRLYHFWFSPGCRAVRIALLEKDVEFDLELEPVWKRRPEFLALSPSGETPVLVEPDGAAIAGAIPILEYLEETEGPPNLLGETPQQRAETRRLVSWFHVKLGAEVTGHVVREKVFKRFLGLGAPDSQAIRAASENVRIHMDYIGYLSERRRWLAGDSFSLADIAAAAHLSCLDYFGDAPWKGYAGCKDWYARVKSRPSFRPLLYDRVAGLNPPKHYGDLDF